MGMNFRKSFKFGPFRTTISKSGVSTSFGVKGARITKRADGRTQGTLGIPGTGVYYTQEIAKDVRKPRPQGGSKPTGNKPTGSDNTGMPNGCIGCAAVALVLVFIVMIFNAALSISPGSSAPTTEPPSRVVPVITKPTPPSTVALPEETEPTTEPATVPAAVATTAPTTEPTTEPTTKPTTKPTEPPDPEYDYVLNTNTKKFHYEWCSSADDIKEKNRREFTGTRDEVTKKGYDPCGRCKP